MLRFFLERVLILMAATAVLLQAPAEGQAVSEAQTRAMKLSQLYNGGMMYFEGGLATGEKEKFTTAISKFEEFLGMLTAEEKLKTPLTYLALAECWYRLGGEENIKKAIDLWKEFIQKWPTDPKVLEVKMAIAQSYMVLKQWETAVGWWAQIETLVGKKNMPVREHALSGQAFCYMKLKKPEDEVPVLERLVYNPEFNTQVSAEGAVRLMSLYALQHDPAKPETTKFADKAIELLLKLQKKVYLVENFIALNGIAIKLGDELLDVNAYAKALEAYWSVRPRDVVIQMQKERIAAMELRMEQGIKAAGKDPKALAAAQRLNEDYIKPRVEEAKSLLAKFEALPDFMPSLYFRMARCFADMDKKWEAIVVFNQILADYPMSEVREKVIFSRLALYADLRLAERTYTLCDEYLKEYPAGPHAGEVGYIKGITAMRKQDWFVAEQNFEAALKLLATLPGDQKKLYWKETRYHLANARFLQNKFEKALADFTAFIAEFGHEAEGRGAFMEDVEYQLALCHLFAGHYMKDPEKPGDEDGAIERLTAYLAKWSGQSSYGSDAKYRLAVCHFAAYENELAVKDCEEWFATYGDKKGEILHPEIYALLGDAKAALKEYPAAAGAYVESYKRAVTDEVLNYALFEAGKMYQKAGDWEAIEKLYTEFVRTRPEHPAAVTSVYWMGKAKAKLGRMDEAKTITIEALKKHIGEPKRQGVEMMLGQLAEWARRRPQSTVLATTDAPLPEWDPKAELDRVLNPLAENANATTQARLMYAAAEMERILRKPENRVKIIAEIGDKTKPEDLSPHLLMECGDSFMARGEVDRAEKLYRTLKETYPKSDQVDAGWVGLADVNFSRKDYTKAMELYSHAIDRLGAPWKLKEALIGQARCHLEFGTAEKDKTPVSAQAHFAKARKLFEEIASVREWRGESTAMSLYYIAECLFRMGDFKAATSAFERVTVSQNKYPAWVARSYLRASDGYYRQGKDDLAKERLRDLIEPKDEKRAERFKDLPEVEEAKKKLTSLGGSV